MNSGIDVLTIDDSVDDPQFPERDLLPEGTWVPPSLEVPGGVTERMGTLALKPETDGSEKFGELEETAPATVSTITSEVDDVRDLLDEDDQLPEQVSQTSSEPAEAAVDKPAQPSETPDVRHGFLSLFASQVEARDPEAAAKIREYRDGGSGDDQTGERTTTAHCGKMSDIVGMEDPDGPFGGFLRDLAFILPGGRAMFETPYHTACREWFESRSTSQA